MAVSLCTLSKCARTGVLADPADSTDRWRKSWSAAASSGCHGEVGSEVYGEKAIVKQAKG